MAEGNIQNEKANLRKTFKGGLYYMWFKEFIRLLFNHFLYKKVYYIGTEKILEDGKPQVIVSDHQNCLVDAIAVMLSFNGAGRKPYFWARADIFAVHKLLEKYLRFLGLMPAFRMDHEGLEDVGKNSASFDESYHLLLHGQSVMIFPEAGHQDKRYLGHFTTGYTTMAFKTAEKGNWEKEIFILPVANHYTNYFGMRREMCVMFSSPISLKPYYELYKEKPRTAMREVNAVVRKAVSSMMLDIQDLENYNSIDFLRTNYGRTFASLNKMGYKTLPEKLEVEKKFVAALAGLDGQVRSSVYKEAEDIRTFLEDKKITFKGLSKKVSWTSTILKLAGMFVLLPLWIFSLWPNFFNYQIPKKLTKRVKDKMLSSSFLLGINAVVTIPLFAIISFVLVWCFMTVYMAVIYLLLTPPLALFCWYYTEWWDKVKEELRLLRLSKKSNFAILQGFRKNSEKLEDRLWSIFKK
ncbi:MAG: 1-acyl-sn-glycerol-3-phosphate acyltransferase [Bacteroidales bacterium]|nr:1-acyl-sn-glycerol-3-phosphate acyltransferase [Bacteroidales bacterium]